MRALQIATHLGPHFIQRLGAFQPLLELHKRKDKHTVVMGNPATDGGTGRHRLAACIATHPGGGFAGGCSKRLDRTCSLAASVAMRSSAARTCSKQFRVEVGGC